MRLAVRLSAVRPPSGGLEDNRFIRNMKRKEFTMSKWLAVAALGVAMICGCDSMKKKDASTTQPMKMSASGQSSAKCTACDASKAK